MTITYSMTQQIMLNKYDQEFSHPNKVGSDAKNALSANKFGIIAADFVGLTWIFSEDDYNKC